MEPASYVSTGKIGVGDSEKSYYQYLWRVWALDCSLLRAYNTLCHGTL